MLRSAGIIAAAVLVIGAPVVGAVVLAQREARDLEFQRVGWAARAVMDRTQTVARQSKAAMRLLDAHRGDAPCSPANIALMRQIDLGSSYLQAVGYVAGNRLMCSSLGDHGRGVPLGPVKFVSPFGDGMRPRVRLPMLPGKDLLVAEANGSAVLVHPELITDAAPGPDLWTGIVNVSSRAVMVERGRFRDRWLAHAPEHGAAYLTEGDRIVALYRPRGHDFVGYAAAPAAALAQRSRTLAWQLGPIGAFVGLVLWLVLRWRVQRSRSLPSVLKAAIDGDEICVEYQPVVDLGTGRWVGAEALVRWRRPDGSLIRPDVFIQVAEDNGLIGRLTERVITIVGREARPLVAAHPDFHLAINLSSADLASWHTVRLLADLLNRSGIAPRNITIEATERGLLNADVTLDVLRGIRALGIRVAIDDFGTGYSGLSYLGKFEADTLKIDKSFVDTVGTDAVTSDVAVHIIELAKTLKLAMVAEGIERPEQAEFLRRHGVQYGQGWLFARSMPMDGLIASLDAAEAAAGRRSAGMA